jgi:transposase
MLQLSFTEDDLKSLAYERFHHPHPRVQRRMEALWLKSQGLPHAKIALLCGVSENTLRSYFRAWQAGGFEGLKTLHFRRPTSELEEHRGMLEDYFYTHPPHTANQAQAKIEELTGLKRSPTQVRQFLKRLGLRRLKVGCLPAKADAAAQEEFKKNSWSPA